MTLLKHIIKESPIGEITIIWKNDPKFQIEEIILSHPKESSSEIAQKKYEKHKELKIIKSYELDKILEEMNKYFNKQNYKFSLDYLNLDKLKPFQKSVLIEEFNSKKGTINTYKTIAKAINKPKAYRAVGSALARNPYPIIIPCHRTVKTNKTLGGFNGFQGGLESKKTLLELEGIEIQGKKIISNSPIISLDKTKQSKLI